MTNDSAPSYAQACLMDQGCFCSSPCGVALKPFQVTTIYYRKRLLGNVLP